MAMDGREVILAAAQAALDEARRPRRRRSRLPAGGAILLGAGAVTAWRLVARSRGREVLGALEDRLLEYEERRFSGVEPLDGRADDVELDEPEGDEPDEDEDAVDEEDEESSRSASAGGRG